MLPGKTHLRSADKWNQLPTSIRQMDSRISGFGTFKRHRKTSLLRKRTARLINSLLLAKLLFPLIFGYFDKLYLPQMLVTI